MRPVHALWPLLIGLICAESLFEDRQGSGNLRQIQIHAAKQTVAVEPAAGQSWAPPYDDEDGGGAAQAAAIPVSNVAPGAVLPANPVATAGPRIAPPKTELIERAMPPS